MLPPNDLQFRNAIRSILHLPSPSQSEIRTQLRQSQHLLRDQPLKKTKIALVWKYCMSSVIRAGHRFKSFFSTDWEAQKGEHGAIGGQRIVGPTGSTVKKVLKTHELRFSVTMPISMFLRRTQISLFRFLQINFYTV